VAYDALAGTASVRTVAFEVPDAEGDRLRLSSLVVVNRVEKLTPADQQVKNPLQFGEAMLYPSLGAPFRKSTMQAVGFFFSVYGTAAAASNATIEVQQGSRAVARTTSVLPAPDASGRIQHAGAVPLQSLAAGSYALKVTVGDGVASDSRVAPFTVVE
jgi:hypothetical protein